MKFHTGALNISELMSRETCEGWFQPFFVLWELLYNTRIIVAIAQCLLSGLVLASATEPPTEVEVQHVSIVLDVGPTVEVQVTVRHGTCTG